MARSSHGLAARTTAFASRGSLSGRTASGPTATATSMSPRSSPVSASRSLFGSRAVNAQVFLAVCVAAVAMAAACAPPARQSTSETNPTAPQGPKRLRMGILQEPKSWGPFAGTSSAGGAQQPTGLTTRTLTVLDADDHVLPVLAASVP